MQEVYFTLAGEDVSASFAETVKVLDDYFIPKANVPFERHLFRQIAQEPGETVDQFVCKLRRRAVSCEFGDKEDDYIRDQVIDKCLSTNLRRRFLEKEGELTLDTLLRIARSQEAVDRQLKVMGTNTNADQVNAIGKPKGNKPRFSGVKVCYACGMDGHFRTDKKCPARDKACRKCGGIGHFRVRCSQNQCCGNANNRGRVRKAREANQVTEREDHKHLDGSVQQPDYAFSVEQWSEKHDSGLISVPE